MTVCVCCKRSMWADGAWKIDSGPIHGDCWIEHHSSPTEAHGCDVDRDLTI